MCLLICSWILARKKSQVKVVRQLRMLLESAEGFMLWAERGNLPSTRATPAARI